MMTAAMSAAGFCPVRPFFFAVVPAVSSGGPDSPDLSLGAAFGGGPFVTRFAAEGPDATDAAVGRYARRNPPGEGYIVPDDEAEPFAREVFLREIGILNGYPLGAVNRFGAPSAVEARLVIDRDPHAAPLGRGLFGADEELGPWRRPDLSEEAWE